MNNIRLEEFYSYTEKIQQKRTRNTKQNKGKLCTANIIVIIILFHPNCVFYMCSGDLLFGNATILIVHA